MLKPIFIDWALVDSDVFIDLPYETQLLYFHLVAHRNKEGIVNNPKAIQRAIGVSEGALKMLFVNGYVLEADEEGEVFVVNTLTAFKEMNDNGNQENS